MKKGIIFFLLFIVVLVVGFTLLYFLYEKPAEQDELNSYATLNIVGKYNNTNVVTNYKVYVNGMLYSNGTTLSDGFSYQRVPSNSSVSVYNYYTYEHYMILRDSTPQRVELILKKPGTLNITKIGKLNGEKIYLNVTSIGGDFKGLRFCIGWSIHIITVRVNSTKMSDNNCYDAEIDLNSTNNYFLTLDYNYFGKIDNADYIKVKFLDVDCENTCSLRKDYTVSINNI
jgi:hypothetical protein